ncbi:putative urea active transporter 1 [Pseudocercospora fuligena]|uniref:Putative urea active transporter 1 n=1 Tax=Pseudocercospora fuligena TaxID=685502 RepID=A0A8H6RLA6_9PEZI|nr:putative urea active transporter 1 [Pseudocercospora fuligena]
MSTKPVLSQGTGYGLIIGLGFLFAFGMIFCTFVLKRYNNERQTSEVFSTAGRTVKTGLVSSAVVSSWTWAATVMQSSAIAYQYGVSGPFWYASGATAQILLFATLAIELKRKAPNAHTFLEAIRARYGGATHAVYIVFGLMTNILVTAMLLTGGSAVATSLSGVPTAAACFLLPVGVVMYTIFGGIKATFLTDYVHTLVVMTVLFIFGFTAYATSDLLGSPGAGWEALTAAAERHPVDGNAQGSYLTMRSRDRGIFFLINITGNFATVFLDNGYWNKAIAASPVHALPDYVAGGLAWFAIPWMAATTMGLSALALENNPVFPTYPNRMDPADVKAGLVLPDAAVALMGSGGAAATLVLVFMAVTSAMSAELIAVSTICTYDIYKAYINPQATSKKLIRVSHLSCIIYSICLAGFSTGLYYAGISLGYLYLLMGVIVSGAVLPATATLFLPQQSWAAATFSPPMGLACSLISWLTHAKSRYGSLDLASTGNMNPMLTGNLVSLLSPIVFIPILSFLFKSPKYDWQSMKMIRRDEDHAHTADPELLAPTQSVPSVSAKKEQEEAESSQLARSAKIAGISTIALTIATVVLWPMPMFGTGYIFSKKFFTGWVVVTFIWLFCSAICVGVYPLWEGRETCARTIRAMIMDVTGKGRPMSATTLHGQPMPVIVEEDKESDKDNEKKEAVTPPQVEMKN